MYIQLTSVVFVHTDDVIHLCDDVIHLCDDVIHLCDVSYSIRIILRVCM